LQYVAIIGIILKSVQTYEETENLKKLFVKLSENNPGLYDPNDDDTGVLMYFITIVVSILFSIKLSANIKSAYLMVKYLSIHNRLNYINLWTPIIMQTLTWFTIAIAGGCSSVFNKKISKVLEGWVLSFLIQEVPKVVLELANFLELDLKERVKPSIKFKEELIISHFTKMFFFGFPCLMMIVGGLDGLAYDVSTHI
jgi:hypothetical protein